MSFEKKQEIFTTELTNNVLVIDEAFGVTAVGIRLKSGVGFYQGTKKLGAISSVKIDLVVDKPVTISAEQSRYIHGLIIDCQAVGVIEIIAR